MRTGFITHELILMKFYPNFICNTLLIVPIIFQFILFFFTHMTIASISIRGVASGEGVMFPFLCSQSGLGECNIWPHGHERRGCGEGSHILY